MTLPHSTQPIVILTALRLEARAIGRAIGLRVGTTGAPRRAKSLIVALHDVGVGAADLAAVQNLRAARLVIVAGLAGALDPSLNIGDVVVDAPGHPSIEKLTARYGKLYSADQLAATLEMKSRLWRETGALAVEMEQAAVEKAVEGTGIPVIGIRAISDTAHETLSPALLSLIDEHGAPRPLALASSLLRRPVLLRELFRLAKSSRKATLAMSAAVRAVLESQSTVF